MNKGYSHPVDWYACGILLYEMMYGRPPFMSNDTYELFQMTLKSKILFPKNFDSHAKSLIKKLCKHDLSERYGNLHGGVNDIKNHKFFADINWNDMVNQSIKAPYVPEKKLITQGKDEKIMKFELLTEANDNRGFPPIKAERDVFLSFF